MLEYKASQLSIEAKYKGDAGLLSREIQEKFGLSRNNAKGIAQIARNIRNLFGLGNSQARPYSQLPVNSISNVFPVLIVLDESLGTPLMNWKLNSAFESIIGRWLVPNSLPQIKPLTVITLEDLEVLAPNLQSRLSLLDCLTLKCDAQENLRVPFQDFMRVNFYQGGADRNTFLENRYTAFSQRINTLFFGQDHGPING